MRRVTSSLLRMPSCTSLHTSGIGAMLIENMALIT
jgi:hypothetical protein